MTTRILFRRVRGLVDCGDRCPNREADRPTGRQLEKVFNKLRGASDHAVITLGVPLPPQGVVRGPQRILTRPDR